MMGNPKPQKPGLRQIALTSDVHGSNVIVLPLPCAREEEENIGMFIALNCAIPISVISFVFRQCCSS